MKGIDELFPALSERVVFGQNPLVEVVCAVEFLPDLNIDVTPTQFHDLVREVFPLYEVEHGDNGDIEHLFYSHSTTWQVLLSRDTLGLSTTSYERWEGFHEKWSLIVDAMSSAYPAVSECGKLVMRYTNVLERDVLGLGGVPWRELIAPPFGGLLHELSEAPSHMYQEYTFEWEAGRELNIGFGFSDGVTRGDSRFVLDSLFVYDESFEVGDHGHVQQELRAYTGRVFGAFITEKTREALEPRAVEE